MTSNLPPRITNPTNPTNPMNKRELRKFRENYSPVTFNEVAIGDRCKLAVHFDEKDEVKTLGARWEPDPSGKGGHWWIASDDLLDDVHPGVGTKLDVLNDKKMIVGPSGTVQQRKVQRQIADMAQEDIQVHDIYSEEKSLKYSFTIYGEIGIASFLASPDDYRVPTETNYMWLEEARTLWDEQMEQGFRPIVEEMS